MTGEPRPRYARPTPPIELGKGDTTYFSSTNKSRAIMSNSERFAGWSNLTRHMIGTARRTRIHLLSPFAVRCDAVTSIGRFDSKRVGQCLLEALETNGDFNEAKDLGNFG